MVISGLPVVELRGGVPVGLWMGIPPAQTFLLACLGNFIPVPFIILALTKVDWLMQKVRPRLEKKVKDVTGTTLNWQYLVSRRRAERAWATHLISRPAVRQAVFVGVPLPGTGAWTGAAIAALFNMSVEESILGIVLGILSAGAIMTAVVLAGEAWCLKSRGFGSLGIDGCGGCVVARDVGWPGRWGGAAREPAGQAFRRPEGSQRTEPCGLMDVAACEATKCFVCPGCGVHPFLDAAKPVARGQQPMQGSQMRLRYG
jgi:uncharacterized membrane protein